MRDADGRVLNVRKRGTHMFMLPGGKPEAGESPAQTALREFHEELGVRLKPADLEPLGEFRAPAANEAGRDVLAHVFTHPFVPGLAARAEIDALEWVDPRTTRDDMAPLNTLHVFPAILRATSAQN